MNASDSTDDAKQPNLRAFHNFQPIGEPTLRVEGTIPMPTPGYTLALSEAVPQGINPAILVLDLEVTRPDGIVAQVITPTPVGFRKETRQEYAQVSVRRSDGGEDLPPIDVQRVD